MGLVLAISLVILIILIQYLLYKKHWNDELKVDVSFDSSVVYEGAENVLREVITNGKWLPLPILQIKFSITREFVFERQESASVTDNYYRNEFFTVMPYMKITRSYPFICAKRGLYWMNSMDIICRSLFLEKKMIEPLEHEASVCVLPRKIAEKCIPVCVNNLLGDIEKNMHINEDPFTFAGIRDYQPFDSMHSINWKVTARLSKLQVNQYNTTFSKKVVILLNVSAHSMQNEFDISEWVIRIAAHIARVLVMQRMPVAVYTNGLDIIDGKCPQIQAGAVVEHIRTVETALARIDLKQRPESFAKLMENTVVDSKDAVEYLIISNSRKNDEISAYEKLLNMGYNAHYIIPEFEYIGIEDKFDSEKYTGWIITDEDEEI